MYKFRLNVIIVNINHSFLISRHWKVTLIAIYVHIVIKKFEKSRISFFMFIDEYLLRKIVIVRQLEDSHSSLSRGIGNLFWSTSGIPGHACPRLKKWQSWFIASANAWLFAKAYLDKPEHTILKWHDQSLASMYV